MLPREVTDCISVATHAYQHAKSTLMNKLTDQQMQSIETVQNINDLHCVAAQAQEENRRHSRWTRGQNVLLTLDRYKGVLDVIAQAHAEYTSFVWGVIKWILTFAVEHINLLRRLSVMLEDIGYRLPRIRLYQNLLPNKRLARVISELYAAIIGFLTDATLFFHNRFSD